MYFRQYSPWYVNQEPSRTLYWKRTSSLNVCNICGNFDFVMWTYLHIFVIDRSSSVCARVSGTKTKTTKNTIWNSNENELNWHLIFFRFVSTFSFSCLRLLLIHSLAYSAWNFVCAMCAIVCSLIIVLSRTWTLNVFVNYITWKLQRCSIVHIQYCIEPNPQTQPCALKSLVVLAIVYIKIFAQTPTISIKKMIIKS